MCSQSQSNVLRSGLDRHSRAEFRRMVRRAFLIEIGDGYWPLPIGIEEPYTMSLTDTDGKRAVVEVVNQFIDSHLEACYCPERGDRFEVGARIVGKRILCETLDCCVSRESLPVLLRRLFELDTDDEHVADAAMSVAGDILLTLGFDECGQFVGREALGLA